MLSKAAKDGPRGMLGANPNSGMAMSKTPRSAAGGGLSHAGSMQNLNASRGTVRVGEYDDFENSDFFRGLGGGRDSFVSHPDRGADQRLQSARSSAPSRQSNMLSGHETSEQSGNMSIPGWTATGPVNRESTSTHEAHLCALATAKFRDFLAILDLLPYLGLTYSEASPEQLSRVDVAKLATLSDNRRLQNEQSQLDNLQSKLRELARQNRQLLNRLCEKEQDLCVKEYTLKTSAAALAIPPKTTFVGRLRTFTGWPHNPKIYPHCTPDALAKAGFIYTPIKGFKDQVSCVYCELTLGNWTSTDIPAVAHRDLSPECEYICGKIVEKVGPVDSDPRVVKEGSTWLVEYHKGDCKVVVPNRDENSSVHIFQCHGNSGSVMIAIEGVVKSIFVVSCSSIALVVNHALFTLNISKSQTISVVIAGFPPAILISESEGASVMFDFALMRADCVVLASKRVSFISNNAASKDRKPVNVPDLEKITFFRGKIVRDEETGPETDFVDISNIKQRPGPEAMTNKTETSFSEKTPQFDTGQTDHWEKRDPHKTGMDSLSPTKDSQAENAIANNVNNVSSNVNNKALSASLDAQIALLLGQLSIPQQQQALLGAVDLSGLPNANLLAQQKLIQQQQQQQQQQMLQQMLAYQQLNMAWPGIMNPVMMPSPLMPNPIAASPQPQLDINAMMGLLNASAMQQQNNKSGEISNGNTMVEASAQPPLAASFGDDSPPGRRSKSKNAQAQTPLLPSQLHSLPTHNLVAEALAFANQQGKPQGKSDWLKQQEEKVAETRREGDQRRSRLDTDPMGAWNVRT